MRIAIDCFKLVKGAGKSIGIYNVALNIVQNLATKNVEKDNKKDIYVFGNKYNKDDFEIDGIRFICIDKYNPLSKKDALLWELFLVNKECRKHKIERIIFPRGFTTIFHPIEDIVIIHDLIPFYYNENYPNQFNKLENAYIMYRLKQSANSSKRIITISEASKQDIINRFSIEEPRITVINNAVGNIGYKPKKTPDSKEYILAMTSNLPHKNAVGVIRSYEEYCKKTNKPLKLKIIGIENISQFCNLPKGIEKNIECYRFIKDNENMYNLIFNSTCFMFLSLIEGFGLPPIEAMQLRTPVICSNLSSLPEVVGDAAITVNPNNYGDVSDAIVRLTYDKDLQNELIEKGISNVQRFSNESRAELYWKEIIE